jgi:phosphonatase-like hydrolase
MSRIRLVIFDVAGTIIEDHGEVLTSLQEALERNGVVAAEAELSEWKGASKMEVIRHFVEAEEKVTRTYEDFRRLLEGNYRDRGVIPIAGAEATFGWLRERGIRMATTTGFYREVNDLILEQTGWREWFQASVSSSDVAQGRPSPLMILRAMELCGVVEVSEVINVGDTPLDLQAGTNAGVAGVVGVLTGLHKEERLRRERHTHIIESVAKLPRLIEECFQA